MIPFPSKKRNTHSTTAAAATTTIGLSVLDHLWRRAQKDRSKISLGKRRSALLQYFEEEEESNGHLVEDKLQEEGSQQGADSQQDYSLHDKHLFCFLFVFLLMVESVEILTQALTLGWIALALWGITSYWLVMLGRIRTLAFIIVHRRSSHFG